MANKQRAKEACAAHTDLNVFAIIQHLLEGGHLYTTASSQTSAQKIVAICLAEQQRQLRAMDAALNKITEADDGK